LNTVTQVLTDDKLDSAEDPPTISYFRKICLSNYCFSQKVMVMVLISHVKGSYWIKL